MNKLPKIKTTRLRKALNSYFEFKAMLQKTTGDVSIPKDKVHAFDSICMTIFEAARAEKKSVMIIAGTIEIGEKLPSGKKRYGFISNRDDHKTSSWEIMENL